MGEVIIFTDNLMFAARVEAVIKGALPGVAVSFCQSLEQLQGRIAVDLPELLIADLKDSVAELGFLSQEQYRALPKIGIYAHVDVDTKKVAEGFRFDFVVPRSRFMREGEVLIKQLMKN